MVAKLRKITGQGMMDCKSALQEANGDIDQAIQILRKKGLAVLTKRADRETFEGTVISWESGDLKMAGLAVLRCETDFVARSDDFAQMVEAIREGVRQCDADEGRDSLLKTTVGGKKLGDTLNEVAGKTGEKVHLVEKEYERFCLPTDKPGLIRTYIHFNGKVGAMVKIETSNETMAQNELMKRVAKDIAMHITATNPLALDRSGNEAKVDWAKAIKQEKDVFAAQVKNKPPDMIDKIVEGKMKKFYAENCLLEQRFVKDDSKSVAQVLDESAKQAGGQVEKEKIRFVRFAVG